MEVQLGGKRKSLNDTGCQNCWLIQRQEVFASDQCPHASGCEPVPASRLGRARPLAVDSSLAHGQGSGDGQGKMKLGVQWDLCGAWNSGHRHMGSLGVVAESNADRDPGGLHRVEALG